MAADDFDVIIVGGGVAGLSAAQFLLGNEQQLPIPYWLKQRKAAAAGRALRVVVLEGRERLGGRIHTLSIETGDGERLAVDIGANFIHGIDGNPVYEILSRRGVRSLPTKWDSDVTVKSPERQHRAAEMYRLVDRIEDMLDEARRRHRRSCKTEQDLSIGELSRRYLEPKYAHNPDMLFALRYALALEIECNPAASIEHMSGLYWDDEADERGAHHYIPGGYQQLVDVLRRDVDVRTEAVVCSVHAQPSGVTVACADGRRYRAARVVVTAPLGVLKAGSIQFEPALPALHRAAIDSLAMANLVWAVVFFDTAWWPAELFAGRRYVANMSTVWGLQWPWIDHYTVHTGSTTPMLRFVTGGSAGARVDTLSDAELQDELLAVLGQLTGVPAPPRPTRLLRSRWSADPFARGTYSVKPVGFRTDAYRQLNTPVDGRIYFAGEHTDPHYPSTVHGAYASGVRAALAVLSSK